MQTFELKFTHFKDYFLVKKYQNIGAWVDPPFSGLHINSAQLPIDYSLPVLSFLLIPFILLKFFSSTLFILLKYFLLTSFFPATSIVTRTPRDST